MNNDRAPAAGALVKSVAPVDLGAVITKAAAQAKAKVNQDDAPGNAGTGGAAPNPAPVPAPDPVPTPANGGTGGTANGPGGETEVPTLGDALVVNDPKSPADAMSNARERYQRGDVSGGLV